MSRIKMPAVQESSDAFTSMIDIVFLLLIFFILQPFKEPEISLAAELPSKPIIDDARPHEPEAILIRIIAVPADQTNARYVIDGQILGAATQDAGALLASALVRRSHGLADTPVKIMPDHQVHFGHVLKALDACYQVRMPNVSFGYGD